MASFLRPTTRAFRYPLSTGFQARLFTTTPSTRSVARMTLVGRLAAAPEATLTASGQTMYRYAVGTSHGPTANRETSWFSVVAFSSEGDAGAGRARILETLEKGTLVYVEADGRMNTVPIAGTEGQGEGGAGKTRKALSLVQRNLQILSRPQNRSDGADSGSIEAGGASN